MRSKSGIKARQRTTFIEVRLSCDHWWLTVTKPRKRDFVQCGTCKKGSEVVGFGDYTAHCETSGCDWRRAGITSGEKAEHQARLHSEAEHHRVTVHGFENASLKVFVDGATVAPTFNQT